MKIRKKLLKVWLDIFDLVVFLIYIFGIILFIRFFIGTPYTVVGVSMSPTFEQGDRIIVEKITQRFWKLKRGDIIVFVPPWKDIPFIKRIIAVPWEVVKFVDNKTYICNDKTEETSIKAENGFYCSLLQEEYLSKDIKTIPVWGKEEFEVTGGYFVMGDNRGHTSDSLSCFWKQCYQGANYTIPNNYMIGKVIIRLFPKMDFF